MPPCSHAARERLLDAGIASNVSFCIADAERLPMADQSFDCVTIAFGLRNVTDKPAALASMRQCEKAASLLISLEFSRPGLPISQTPL